MWGGAAALCFMSGGQSEDEAYKKSVAVQLHLFAWELPDTVLVSQRVPRGVRVLGKVCQWFAKESEEIWLQVRNVLHLLFWDLLDTEMEILVR